MNLTIGEFSHETGISVHTLRYYEKVNLIHPHRLDNGHRVYDEADISWISFIKRLKSTSMPISEIQTYARLREIGDATFEERMELLIKHRMKLLQEMAVLQDNLDNLNQKIDYYQASIVSRVTDA